jgi:hypothetical protein
MITLPKQVGQRVEFETNGERFYVKKHARDTFSLNYSRPYHRNRWGDAVEIASDIAHVLEFGRLPAPVGERW